MNEYTDTDPTAAVPDSSSTPNGALEGIRVLEIGTLIAGPFAGSTTSPDDGDDRGGVGSVSNSGSWAIIDAIDTVFPDRARPTVTHR